jgi:MoxR-like ATPase
MATAYKPFGSEASSQSFNREDILVRLKNLEDVQNRFILEREQVTRGITIAMVNRENILLSGPPGIAKTTQVRLVAQHIAGGRHFYTQLTPFSTVDDIFGPVDIVAYKSGQHQRVSSGMLQEAHVAIVDEIYNSNEAVLKALMGPMNEGVYAERGAFCTIPLRTLMGTTNSVPTSDELEEKGLLAFHDRWLLRFQLEEIQEERNFLRMLRSPDLDFSNYQPEKSNNVTVEELDYLGKEADSISVPSSVYEQLLSLRDQLTKAHIPGAKC